MKFAHMADCHIGGWREEKLKELNLKAFQKAISRCIEEQVDFVLISGDLFNTSLPGIDKLKETVKQLQLLKVKKIPVYIIAGSHDFSPSGKTMLDVLEEAKLVVNVVKGDVEEGKLKLKFTEGKAKITGMIGKRGMLEKSYYENLDTSNLEAEEGFKIFMFHTAISELKTKEMEKMESSPVSLLPKGFDYYAGGHVHIVKEASLPDYKKIVYPGPLFPNNFSELEKLKRGGFYIYDHGELKYEPIHVINTHVIDKDCKGKTPEEVEVELKNEVKDKTFNNTIVLIRLKGTLKSGKPSDLHLKDFIELLYDKSAYFVMKNSNKLETKEFEEIKVDDSDVDEVEDKLIKEHLGQSAELNIENETDFTLKLLNAFSQEKQEGEKVYEYEARMKRDAKKVIESIKYSEIKQQV